MNSTLHAVCTECNAVNRVPAHREGKEIHCGKCHRPLFGQPPLSVNSETFDQLLRKSEIPVVVDFWAPWCGPCQAMAPAYAQVSARMNATAQFIKVNTDQEQELGNRYGIRSIPTLAVFQAGREIARVAGAMPAAQLEQWLRQAL